MKKFKKEIIGLVAVILVMTVLFIINKKIDVKVDGPIEVKGEIVISKMKVHIAGEVKKPGVYEMNQDDRLEQLVEMAGGFTEEANASRVNLARKLKDGEMIVISKVKDQVTYTGIDFINNGSIEEIKTIDGIGETLAKRIVTYRNKNGFFTNFDDLLNIEGIGVSKVDLIKTHLGN